MPCIRVPYVGPIPLGPSKLTSVVRVCADETIVVAQQSSETAQTLFQLRSLLTQRRLRPRKIDSLTRKGILAGALRMPDKHDCLHVSLPCLRQQEAVQIGRAHV